MFPGPSTATMDPQIQLFYRQYMQQFSALSYPAGELLKQEDVQTTLENAFFANSDIMDVPPSYQAKTLDRIIHLIESAVKDPENEGVSDDLYQRRADLCLRSGNNMIHMGLYKSQLVYHAPTDLSEQSTPILINEAKNIIGSGPNVGLRTWEASLRLAHYLFQNPDLVNCKTVLELGAGTGFLSLFCSSALSAKHVIATDGLEQVLESMRENVRLNEAYSKHSEMNIEIAKLAWEDEDDLTTALQDTNNSLSSLSPSPPVVVPDLVLGADITYHPSALEPLVSLLSRILNLADANTQNTNEPSTTSASRSNSNPDPPPRHPRILISSTIRSEATLSTFTSLCHQHGLAVTEVPFTIPLAHEQKGLFHAVAMEIKIFEIGIRRSQEGED